VPPAGGEEVKSMCIGLMTLMTQALSEVSEEEISRFIDILLHHRSRKVLIMGAGRSGLVGRAFALRLMHLGYNVYVLGDTLVPSIGAGDLVVAISGSGSTRIIVTAVRTAKEVGAKVIAITSYPDSPLGEIADLVVKVKGRVTGEMEGRDYFSRQILGIYEPLAPLGTLFEDSCSVLLDSIVVVMMGKLEMSEEEMKKRHSVVE